MYIISMPKLLYVDITQLDSTHTQKRTIAKNYSMMVMINLLLGTYAIR